VVYNQLNTTKTEMGTEKRQIREDQTDGCGREKKTVSESGQLSWKDAAALDAWRPVRINLGNDVFGGGRNPRRCNAFKPKIIFVLD